MDLLSSLIKAKKYQTAAPNHPSSTNPNKNPNPSPNPKNTKPKYKRRGDIDISTTTAPSAASASSTAPSVITSENTDDKLRSSVSGVKRVRDDGESTGGGVEGKKTRLKLPIAEVKDRLRSRGQPITLFGETEQERYDRLRHVESSHHHVEGIALQGAYAMRNTFLDNRALKKKKKKKKDKERRREEEKRGGVVAPEDLEQEKKKKKEDEEEEEKEEVKGGGLGKDGGEKSSGFVDISAGSMEHNTVQETQDIGKEKERKKPKPQSKEKHIYRFIKQMLSEWEEELETRPDEEKRKAQGRQALKTFKQCKDYIRPFLKKLKTKAVEDSILYHVDKIVSLCEERQYIEAADWYVRLAIGNSPWPIGVTMVGIHERSGRERIESSKVAHVMNDEEQRKYITSMKRIMTFCQKKYPTDHSKMLQ